MRNLNTMLAFSTCFFIIVSVYYANLNDKAKQDCEQTMKEIKDLRDTNQLLRENNKALRSERDRWYQRTIACKGW